MVVKPRWRVWPGRKEPYPTNGLTGSERNMSKENRNAKKEVKKPKKSKLTPGTAGKAPAPKK